MPTFTVRMKETSTWEFAVNAADPEAAVAQALKAFDDPIHQAKLADYEARVDFITDEDGAVYIADEDGDLT